jgi:hypothetical protein
MECRTWIVLILSLTGLPRCMRCGSGVTWLVLDDVLVVFNPALTGVFHHDA